MLSLTAYPACVSDVAVIRGAAVLTRKAAARKVNNVLTLYIQEVREKGGGPRLRVAPLSLATGLGRLTVWTACRTRAGALYSTTVSTRVARVMKAVERKALQAA